ncbi:MAG: hypothetical protein V4555_02285, partial [Acidobacteriota bacterium]
MGTLRRLRITSLSLSSVLSLAILGCAPSPHLSSPASLHLAGQVHGGEQPVNGATIQLYAVGTTGDASAATPLLKTAVTTSPDGSFSITSDYDCPSNTDLVYLVATGGNPGLTSGTTNSALALMAALGSCTSIKSAPITIAVNELTTVGSLAALYPFANSYAALGSANSDAAQLTTAFNTVNDYTGISTGTVPGPALPAGQYASSVEIDTLANILSTCINSTGGVAGDHTACGNLFALAQPQSSPAPTDTITAVIDILKNPTVNVAAIFGLAPASGAPYQPALSSSPSDWTLP